MFVCSLLTMQVGRGDAKKYQICYQICIPIDDPNAFMDAWNLTSNMNRALIQVVQMDLM